MKIQDAIKSGKPFKLPYMKFWLQVTAMDCVIRDNGSFHNFHGEEIQSADWQIKKPKLGLWLVRTLR